MRIPSSFRDSCECCNGRGDHPGCHPGEFRGCTRCDGAGYVLNKLGADTLRLWLEFREKEMNT